MFAELSPIVVDGAEHQGIFVLVDGVQNSYNNGFTTDSDITKIVGYHTEFNGFFGYTLLEGYRIATVTGHSVSNVPSPGATIVGESIALVPGGSDDPIIFPSSTQFVEGTGGRDQ